MDVQELRPGLWRWTAAHPEWEHAETWGPEVGSVYAELPDAVVLVDPLVPADDAEERFWAALDRDVERLGRPVYILLTVHWHERSVEAMLARYKATLWRPEEKVDLPAGVEPIVVEGSDWKEAMFFLEPHRALVVGDLLIGTEGGIEVPVKWFPVAEQDWARTELKADLRSRLLPLSIELVLVSHGEPILADGHAALAQALEM
jgi:glyoxylase-like metal-dependent hydrolase (beta-lactamase superfamily II)